MTEEQNVTDESAKSLDTMTVKELREVAKTIDGLTGFSSMKKDELLEKINAAQGGDAAAPAKAETKAKKKHVGAKKKKKLLTVADIKKEITKLRSKKVTVQKAADKKKVDVIRRKISRLKKKSRKVANA